MKKVEFELGNPDGCLTSSPPTTVAPCHQPNYTNAATDLTASFGTATYTWPVISVSDPAFNDLEIKVGPAAARHCRAEAPPCA